jgi:hypothetical protein
MDTDSNEIMDMNGNIFNDIYNNNNRKVTIIVIVVFATISLLLLILYLGYLYGLQFNECYNIQTDKIGNYNLAEGVELSTETMEISCSSECKIKNKNTQSQSVGQYYFDNDSIILGSNNQLNLRSNIIKNPNPKTTFKESDELPNIKIPESKSIWNNFIKYMNNTFPNKSTSKPQPPISCPDIVSTLDGSCVKSGDLCLPPDPDPNASKYEYNSIGNCYLYDCKPGYIKGFRDTVTGAIGGCSDYTSDNCITTCLQPGTTCKPSDFNGLVDSNAESYKINSVGECKIGKCKPGYRLSAGGTSCQFIPTDNPDCETAGNVMTTEKECETKCCSKSCNVVTFPYGGQSYICN